MAVKRDEELLGALADSARPIDFDALIAEGIIEPDGNWYLVPDLKKLPRHAEMKLSKRRMTKKGLKVQFREPRRHVSSIEQTTKSEAKDLTSLIYAMHIEKSVCSECL